MNIALQSASYWPRIGGIETVARLLAEEFAALGHAPVVLTDTPTVGADGAAVQVLRRASLTRRVAALRSADAVLMFGMSLRFFPLPALLLRPIVVSHQTWYDGGAAGRLKQQLSRFTPNIAPSQAVRHALATPAAVIPNPYDDGTFFRRHDIERDRDVAFVGRLVSDKGLALLIEALARLARDGLRPRLTVIGTGPEDAACRHAAAAAGIHAQVEWAGSVVGEALAVELNRHRVLAVPSLWREPFGIVALEGLACGCALVGSNGGGLPEAIGSCGRTFPNGDAGALAAALRAALEGADRPAPAMVDEHLRGHTRRAVALRYLEVLESAAARR